MRMRVEIKPELRRTATQETVTHDSEKIVESKESKIKVSKQQIETTKTLIDLGSKLKNNGNHVIKGILEFDETGIRVLTRSAIYHLKNMVKVRRSVFWSFLHRN